MRNVVLILAALALSGCLHVSAEIPTPYGVAKFSMTKLYPGGEETSFAGSLGEAFIEVNRETESSQESIEAVAGALSPGIIN